jgi:protein O-GlcNAc transferase
VQRLASRVLHVAGHSEWVATSIDDYVRIARTLAASPHQITECRATLRDQLRSGPLFDHRGITRDLETAYRRMWQTWCSQP